MRSAPTPPFRIPRRLGVVILFVVGALALLWIAPMIGALVDGFDVSGLGHPYAIIGAFVVIDAIVPLFPSESLLTTASTLIAGDGTDMRLGPLIATGAIAAVIGDSALFLLARTIGRKHLTDRLDRLQRNERAAAGLRVLGSKVGTVIVGGRFVPGLRFVVNATMGLSEIPYRRFVRWAALGGTLWSTYTCVVTYLIGQALGGYPVVSFATSVVISTALLGAVAVPLARRYASEREIDRDAGPTGAPDDIRPA